MDEAAEEDRVEIIDLIETIHDAGRAGDQAALAEACESLRDPLSTW